MIRTEDAGKVERNFSYEGVAQADRLRVSPSILTTQS